MQLDPAIDASPVGAARNRSRPQKLLVWRDTNTHGAYITYVKRTDTGEYVPAPGINYAMAIGVDTEAWEPLAAMPDGTSPPLQW